MIHNAVLSKVNLAGMILNAQCNILIRNIHFAHFSMPSDPSACIAQHFTAKLQQQAAAVAAAAVAAIAKAAAGGLDAF